MKEEKGLVLFPGGTGRAGRRAASRPRGWRWQESSSDSGSRGVWRALLAGATWRLPMSELTQLAPQSYELGSRCFFFSLDEELMHRKVRNLLKVLGSNSAGIQSPAF